jgi:LacI family transcriptional regulator
MDDTDRSAPDESRRHAVTIYDIAEAVGVSPSTVSRALNKPGRINERTERRIREAAEALGYRLNPMARALHTGRTGTIAVILSDITNPVYFDLVRGAERVAADHGYALVLAESQESSDTELGTIERLLPSVDGLVLVASRLPDEEIARLAAVKPIVAVSRDVAGVDAVIPDVTPGLTQALDHLRSIGHHAVGYVSGPPTSWMNGHRWQTLFEAAVRQQMSIVELPAIAPTLEGGRGALPRVLAAGVTAVVAYNDLIAMGLLQECRDRGVAVPAQLSIVGFDDIFGAELVSPALTTIKSPLSRAGSLAVSRLLATVDGGTPPPTTDLATRLVMRSSTGPAPVS